MVCQTQEREPEMRSCLYFEKIIEKGVLAIVCLILGGADLGYADDSTQVVYPAGSTAILMVDPFNDFLSENGKLTVLYSFLLMSLQFQKCLQVTGLSRKMVNLQSAAALWMVILARTSIIPRSSITFSLYCRSLRETPQRG